MKFTTLVAQLILLLAFITPVDAAENAVSLKLHGDGISVDVDGKPFTFYVIDKDLGLKKQELPKPFLSPVRGPDGTVMTRPIAREGDDHPHHKGIWVAVDEVNEVDFWAERGRIENVSLKVLQSQGNPAKFEVVNQWLNKDKQLVVTEKTVVSIFANRLIAYDIEFQAPKDNTVTFGDTKEGLFGFRMVNSMREKEGGHVVNAEGLVGTPACWGKPTAWIDYYGQVEGKTLGVAIFDHPSNFRPSRYHVRNYGLFSISPFGERAYTNGKQEATPVIVAAGGKLQLRYAMYIHAGDTKSANVAGVYQDYLKSTEAAN